MSLSNAGSFPQAADYVEVMLRDLGGLTNSALISLPPYSLRTPDTLESRVAGLVSKYAAGVPLTVTKSLVPLLPTTGPTSAALTATTDLRPLVGAFAFRNGTSVAIVLENHATVPVVAEIDLPFSLSGARLERYDPEGRLMETSSTGGSTLRVSALPGWVYVIAADRTG